MMFRVKAWFVVVVHIFLLPCFAQDHHKPRILLVHLAPWSGGDGVCSFNLYKSFLDHGYHASILVKKDGPLHNRLKEAKLACHAINSVFYSQNKKDIDAMVDTISSICKQEQIDVVNCNHLNEIKFLTAAQKLYPFKALCTYQLPDKFNVDRLKGLDGMILIDASLELSLKEENRKKKLGLKNIRHIPPMYEVKKFFDYRGIEDRDAFFKTNFNLTLKNYPVLCTVGNMYTYLGYKNYPLLLQAMHDLVYKKNRPMYLLIAGSGVTKQAMELKARQMKLLDKYVFFLGHCDKIPGLMQHSDLIVLASKKEAFGIVLLEAALMKKPTIGACGTGAQSIIQHTKTGLLFKNDSVTDLVASIEYVFDHPKKAQEMGQCGYQHVLENFLPEFVFNHYEDFYGGIVG